MKDLRIRRGLVQIGNSKGIIIPNDFLEVLNLSGSDELYLTIRNGKILIEKIREE